MKYLKMKLEPMGENVESIVEDIKKIKKELSEVSRKADDAMNEAEQEEPTCSEAYVDCVANCLFMNECLEKFQCKPRYQECEKRLGNEIGFEREASTVEVEF